MSSTLDSRHISLIHHVEAEEPEGVASQAEGAEACLVAEPKGKYT